MGIQSGIQIIGYFLIPIGLACVFLNIKYLLYLIIFFSGFTGMSVINFGESFSLTPAYFFGILFIIKYVFIVFKKKKIIKPNKLLCFFVLLCIISIFMPNLIHNKNVFIINQDSDWVNVEFTSSNVTQLLYLLLCFIFYYFLKDYLYNNMNQINNVIKLLLVSTVFICLLGFYQEFAYMRSLPFDEIFRSGVHGNIQVQGNFVRLYSVTQEPSMLAYFLAPILALSIIISKDIFKYRLFLIILIILTGLLSTSTTFLIGALALIFKIVLDKLILFTRKARDNNQKIGYMFPVVFVLFILILIIILNNNVNLKNSLINGTINKLQGSNVSGIERLTSFQNHIQVALQYPFLGVGFGTARSKDLLSTWLCNIGFIATGIFIMYLYNLITKLKYINKLGYGISNYIFVLFICAFVSVPEPYFLFIWVILALGESLIIQNKTITADNKLI